MILGDWNRISPVRVGLSIDDDIFPMIPLYFQKPIMQILFIHVLLIIETGHPNPNSGKEKERIK